MRKVLREPMSRPVWLVLVSWGVAVLMISGLLSAWIWSNQHEQDKAMCAMLDLFSGGPEPVPGPEGDRSRAVRAAMSAYRQTLDCGD